MTFRLLLIYSLQSIFPSFSSLFLLSTLLSHSCSSTAPEQVVKLVPPPLTLISPANTFTPFTSLTRCSSILTHVSLPTPPLLLQDQQKLSSTLRPIARLLRNRPAHPPKPPRRPTRLRVPAVEHQRLGPRPAHVRHVPTPTTSRSRQIYSWPYVRLKPTQQSRSQ